MKEPIISRTIINNFATGLEYIAAAKKVQTFVVVLPAAIDTPERAERYISKHNDLLSGKMVSVDKVERYENLVGMPLSVFMANAKPVSERSKETRGAITKTVPGFMVDVLYMDENHIIKTVPATVPAAKDVEKYCKINVSVPGKFVTVENVRAIETLYAMDENTFIALAKPMKNKFTLA